MDELIRDRQGRLMDAIQKNVDPVGSVQGLIQVDCPLKMKFMKLKWFGEVITKNSEDSDSLKRLLMMLNILEKYGRHLLKPADQRSSMWRHIKNSNTIYRDRVVKIWGGTLIMKMMGYTEDRGDGVAFPEGSEPNHDAILRLVADIILGRKELETYIAGTHPHPHRINEHLSKELLSVLNSSSIEPNKEVDTSRSGSGDKQKLLHGVATGSQSSQSSTKSGPVSSSDNKASLGPQSDTEVQNENRAQSIVCDICGKNQANIVCQICDNKQLCADCDTKWHSHPKRQNHQREKLGEPPAPCTGTGSDRQQKQQRTALSEIHQGEAETGYGPTTQHNMPPSMSSQAIYQSLLKPAVGPSMAYEPMIYHQIPSSAQHIPASVAQSQLMYQPQYPPQNIPGQPRMVTAMWGGVQPGSGQYFSHSQMLGVSQMPRVSHIPGESHMPGSGHIPGTQPRGGQSVEYPYSLARGYRENQELRSSFSGYSDLNQAHTLAYFPTAYSGSTPSPASSDPMSLPRYPASTPQGHGDFTFPVNRNQAGTPARYQSKERKNEDAYETPKKIDNTLKRSSSHLVLKLQTITDLQKRRARLDINLATLKEDVEEFDLRINEIIVDNENFIQDPEYNDLSKKKQKHLREIQELEKYEIELEKMIAEASVEKTVGNVQEQAESKQKFAQDRNRLAEWVQGSQAYGTDISNVRFPPDTVHMTDPGIKPDAVGDQLRNISQSTKAANKANQKLPSDRSSKEEHENVRNVEEERKKMDDIRRMLLLNQNPHSSHAVKQEQLGLNIPVSEANAENIQQKSIVGEGVSYPPQIVASSTSSSGTNQNAVPKFSEREEAARPKVTGMQHRPSEPSLTVGPKDALTVRKSSSESNLQLWECEHCTFVNEHSSNVCQMCCKTNDHKKIISMGSHDLEPAKTEKGDKGVTCSKCTFHNKTGLDMCQICGTALSGTTAAATKAGDSSEIKRHLGIPATPGSQQGKKEAVSPKLMSLEKKLEEEQDQIYYEKKAAQQRFQAEQAKNNSAQVLGTPLDESSFVFVESQASPQLEAQSNLGAKPVNQNVASLKKSPCENSLSPSSSQEIFHSAPNSFDQTPTASEGQMLDRKPPPNLNFNEAIEIINMRRAQEQMTLDGHDFVMLIKAAEKEGYCLDEIEISVMHCIDDKMKPLDWLKQKWEELAELVVEWVSEKGKLPGNEDVGELSKGEAKEELMKHKGNLEEAAEACIRNRKDKFKEISSVEEFSREKILTALYQNSGNIENTIDQLNSYTIKDINDHIWDEQLLEGGNEETEGPHRTLVRAEGGRAPLVGADLGAIGGYGADVSVEPTSMNSLAIPDMIRNKDIHRERRIRMILVEAKLQSWGRAETVIIILDTENDQLEDIVDCSLDDIIEAVKNCGDRKRSLAYLRQECGICFSFFPMSKIQSLNSCQCKLCRSCLKQNFEVAIREKYVRNWCCPLCGAPNLEDDTAASSYFEFLQLLLRQMVDNEVKDLFETKLRDWHLQKEVNFRWCAHCASGFVWDRPDVLGMTCPSCHMKTCFKCKKKWEDQHQGLTCEEFTQWKIDNDPNMQAVGLARHLEENGIDCPSCKMRYDLAKGGCMHFKCPQCGHEFCSGCSEPFMQDGTCKLLKDCKGKGLHCHHPRDCFYYLRDYDVMDLQALLKQNKVEYNTETPATQKDPKHCPVMEQKEYGIDKKDEPCGKGLERGMAGLCQTHYKEYLVGLINKNKVDPVDIMGVKDLERCFARMGRQPPKPKNENEAQFKKRFAQLVRESFPLRR